MDKNIFKAIKSLLSNALETSHALRSSTVIAWNFTSEFSHFFPQDRAQPEEKITDNSSDPPNSENVHGTSDENVTWTELAIDLDNVQNTCNYSNGKPTEEKSLFNIENINPISYHDPRMSVKNQNGIKRKLESECTTTGEIPTKYFKSEQMCELNPSLFHPKLAHTTPESSKISKQIVERSGIINKPKYGSSIRTDQTLPTGNISTSAPLHNLVIHPRIPSGEKPYKCDHCDYRTTLRNNLQLHERTHTGEKPYQCEYCDYRSIQHIALQSHERTHTREKPFKCDHCDYRTTQRNHLQRHERTHTGEKPYKCEHCNFSTSYSVSLVYHQRTHTGEKPYKCNHCDYRSIQSTHVRRHEKTHTREKSC